MTNGNVEASVAVHRRRFVTTSYDWRVEGCVGYLSQTLTEMQVVQFIDGARCWRCRSAYRRGDALVDIGIDSEDAVPSRRIYHRGCIPPARFYVFAGSLPA